MGVATSGFYVLGEDISLLEAKMLREIWPYGSEWAVNTRPKQKSRFTFYYNKILFIETFMDASTFSFNGYFLSDETFSTFHNWQNVKVGEVFNKFLGQLSVRDRFLGGTNHLPCDIPEHISPFHYYTSVWILCVCFFVLFNTSCFLIIVPGIVLNDPLSFRRQKM
jgi:hypothetical protein